MRAPCNVDLRVPSRTEQLCSYGSVLLVESGPRARSWRNSKAGSSRYEYLFKEYNVGLEAALELEGDKLSARGWLECALGANSDHIFEAQLPIDGGKAYKRERRNKVDERPARVHGKGRRFAQISVVRQNVIVLS